MMSDSDDAASPGSASAGGGAPPPATEAPQPLHVAPRLHPPTIHDRREPATPVGAGPDISLEELVSWARAFEHAPKPPSTPEAKPAEMPRAHLSREQRKFHKFDPEAAKAEQLAAERVAAEAATVSGQAGSEAGRPGDTGLLVAQDPRAGLRAKKEPRGPVSSLVLQGIVLVLLAASFLAGRATVTAEMRAQPKRVIPLPADSEKPPALLSTAAIGLVDQAMAARSAGAYKKAAEIFDQLRHNSAHIEGLDYQLALIGYESGDYASAMPLLNRSIAEGENVAECYGVRGLIESQRPGAVSGFHDFEAATEANPFAAINFFFWGESLRRLGQPREALVHLRQALDRAQTPVDQSTYRLKVRLTQIEAGQEQQFVPQLDAEMARPKPAVEWLLTAAAREMHAGNFPAAANDLDMARQLEDPAVITATLRDYFFYSYAEQPALARFYAGIAPTHQVGPSVPPATAPASAENPVTLSPLPPPLAVPPEAAAIAP